MAFKPPARRSVMMRALKFLVGSRPGAAMLGAAGGVALGYPLGHRLPGKMASMMMPPGYQVVPRFRVVKTPGQRGY